MQYTPVQRRRRGGNVAAEVILMFPILVGFLLGTIEMSVAFYSRQQFLNAAREGARVAAAGGDLAEVKATVKRILGDGPLGEADVTLTVLEESDVDPPYIRQAVQVCVKVEDMTEIVPNLLPWIIDFEGQPLAACVIMNVQ